MDLFEKATRKKYRFESPVGALSVEDLWDLPMLTSSAARPSLNDIAISINRRIKAVPEENFVSDIAPRDTILEDKLDILKHVIQTKKEEATEAKVRADNKARNHKIREIIEQKGDDALQRKSIKELEKMLTS